MRTFSFCGWIRKKLHLNLFLLAFLAATAACVPLEAITPTPSATPVPPTATPTLTPTATPQPTATPKPVCTETTGSVEQIRLASNLITKEGLQFHIYLPPCYSFREGKRYPVLYMVHGQGFADDQWVRIGVPAVADKVIAAGAPPFIVVMPFDPFHYQQPSQDPFDNAVIEELIPYIDKTYATVNHRTFRAIGGLSRGGGWAIHFGLVDYNLFGIVGGHSPAIFDEEGPQLKRLLDAIPAGKMPVFFLDVGEGDGLRFSASDFEKILSDRNILHEWRLYRGFHNEEYWSKHLEEYLLWYASHWK